MANVDLTIDPYYDKFDSSNNRTMVIFQKDKVVQTAELNEMQSIESYYLQTLGNAIMADGDKQSGMAYSNDSNNITVSSGTVYLAGKVRSFTEQSVTIAGTGIETVGIKLNQTIITANDDNSLLNPAIDTSGYQAVGANRLQETVSLVANDSSATTIYVFNNGSLYYEPDNTQLTKVTNIMAQRTNEIDGNFRLGNTGFQMTTADSPTDSSKAVLTIGSGIAYVLGERINKSVSENLSAPKALTTSTITDEQSSYVSGTNAYPLGSYPVQSVTTVTADVQKTVVVSRGTGTVDSLSDKTITGIQEVYTEGTSGTTYTQGTDYELTNHQSITWLSNGSSPSQGSSYMVTYIYNKTLVQGTDYNLTTDSSTNITSIDFTGTGIVNDGDSTGGVLTSNSIISATYNYYLYRIDVITLDSNGNYYIHQGQPNDVNTVTKPFINDSNSLEIGSVEWVPNSSESVCDTYAISNLTFNDLTELKNRVDNIEFNEALNDLDDIATANYDPTQLRGVFSDGFISFDKADVTNSDFTVKVNFETGTISPQYQTSADSIPTVDTQDSNIIISPDGTFATAGYSEYLDESQPIASSAKLINEYSYYGKTGSLTLSPSEDHWTNYDS